MLRTGKGNLYIKMSTNNTQYAHLHLSGVFVQTKTADGPGHLHFMAGTSQAERTAIQH